MKLRNIFLASLAVCTMASCSKDEEGTSGPKNPVDAQISFVATTALQQTKASVAGTFEDADNLTNETTVKTLTAYVFKKDGGLVARQSFTADEGESIKEIKHITVKVTPENDLSTPTKDKFELVLVANAETVNPSSAADLKNLVLTKTIENYTPGESYLPMIGGNEEFTGLVPLIQEEGVPNKENWVSQSSQSVNTQNEDAAAPTTSYTAISLKRMIARVQVDKLTIDIQKNYKGASFTLDTFALANVRPLATMTDGVKSGSDEYYKGYVSGYYVETTTDPVSGWISPKSPVKDQLAKAYITDQPKYTESTDGNQATTFVADFTSGDNAKKQFVAYAFPNAVGATYKTALIIGGKFKRYAEAPEELKHFRVILEHPNGDQKVEGNYIYKLKITITGEGSKDENHPELNAHVAATIEVADWKVIEQTEDDTN